MVQPERKDPGKNPFRPGFGTAPPFLAGRSREQKALNRNISRLRDRDTSMQAIVLYGPRGMGKTVLLNQFGQACASQGVDVIQESVTSLLASRRALAGALFPWGLDIKNVGASLSQFAVSIGLGGKSAGALSARLIRKCQRKPLALLLDEAHLISDVDSHLARGFLQMCQDAAAQAPFLLALAGTPGLPGALRGLQATFVERAEFLDVGLLEQADGEAAIREPLQKSGIAIEAEALAHVAEDGQRYPYFLQLWGKALWDLANERGLATLTQQDAQRVKPEVDQVRAGLYGGRYDELRGSKRLLAVAHAVADAFAARDAVPLDEMERLAAQALAPLVPGKDARLDAAEAACAELVRLGFAWSLMGDRALRPGIPSLMDYIRNQSRRARTSSMS